MERDMSLEIDLENIRDSSRTLVQVAEFCQDNYALSSDSSHEALELTKDYVNQSLASVAYQINMFSFNFWQLLEQQSSQIGSMSSQLNHVDQLLSIHLEKNSRRRIGYLASDNSRYYNIF